MLSIRTCKQFSLATQCHVATHAPSEAKQRDRGIVCRLCKRKRDTVCVCVWTHNAMIFSGCTQKHMWDKGNPPPLPGSRRPTVRSLATQGTAVLVTAVRLPALCLPGLPCRAQEPCSIRTSTADLTDLSFLFLAVGSFRLVDDAHGSWYKCQAPF